MKSTKSKQNAVLVKNEGNDEMILLDPNPFSFCFLWLFGAPKKTNTKNKYHGVKEVHNSVKTAAVIQDFDEKIALLEAKAKIFEDHKKSNEQSAVKLYDEDKERALRFMAISKTYEKKLAQLRNYLTKMLETKVDLEMADLHTEVISLFDRTSQDISSLSVVLDKLNPVEIAASLENSVDQINDVANVFNSLDQFDEEDLLDDLEKLVNQNQKPYPPVPIRALPSVPPSTIASPQEALADVARGGSWSMSQKKQNDNNPGLMKDIKTAVHERKEKNKKSQAVDTS